MTIGLVFLLLGFAKLGWHYGRESGRTDTLRALRSTGLAVEFTDPEFVRAFNDFDFEREFDALGQWPVRR